MALLTVGEWERMLEYDSIDLLPDLEEDVFFDDVMIIDLEESYTDGMEDWWSEFVEDMYL